MLKYEYSPVDSGGMEIRLLRLPFEIKQFLGKRHSKPLTGTLKNYYLPSPVLSRGERLKRSMKMPTFIALSYVWGEGTLSHEILISGKYLKITSNLYAALRDLQASYQTGDCFIWADAISINQEDFGERSAQIRLMRDIYHLASSVVVWPGPRTEESVRCAKFIACIAGDIVNYNTEDEEESAVEEAVGKAVFIPINYVIRSGVAFGQTIINLADITEPDYRDDKAKLILDPDGDLSLHQQTIEALASWRPSNRRLQKAQKAEDFAEIARLIDYTMLQNTEWFERMWVVQEVGAAESISIQVGEGSVYWESFLKAVHYLHYVCHFRIGGISRITGLEKIRMGWNQGKRQPLRELLWDTRYRKATDPRDKIYSLLGLMGDPMSKLLQPDYTKSVNEVYSNTTHHLIAQNSSLDSLCGQQQHDRRGDLPSWVPDYTLSRDLAASPLVRIDGRESIYAAAGYDYHSKFFVPDINIIPKCWDSLNVIGLSIDTISHASRSLPDTSSLGDIQDQWFSTLLESSSTLRGFPEGARHILDEISLRVRHYSDHFSGKCEEPSHYPEIDLGSAINDTYIIDAYLQTLLCGRISSSERVTQDHMIALMKFQSPEQPSPTTNKEYIGKISDAFEAGMRRRNLAITKGGLIGAVPKEAQPDDIICILFGCSVPVVLREVSSNNLGSTERVYKFVGEAYIHGFMDAEAIAMLIKGIFKAEEFTLK